MSRGMDISVWQSNVDWQKVKNSGIEFVMLRGAYGESTDSKFQNHITGALAVGLNVGVYVYSIANTVEKAIAEAKHVLELVKSYKLTYPIAFDLEDDKQLPLTVEQRTELCIAFCNTIEQADYYAMIYANKYWLETKLNYEKLKCFDIWLAQWTSSPSWNGNYGIWQSGITLVDGAGNVDTDVSYKDYPSIIKGAGLNGWGKSQPTSVQPEPVAPAPVLQEPVYTYSVGQHPVFSTCYNSSTDPISKAIPATKMARNHGEITFIAKGAPNPYLLDKGLCWVNDGDIRGLFTGEPVQQPAEKSAQQTFKDGDRVMIADGAMDLNTNQKLATWVYKIQRIVMGNPNGNRVKVGDGKDVTAVVDINNIRKA